MNKDSQSAPGGVAHAPALWRATQGQLGSIMLIDANGRAIAKVFRDHPSHLSTARLMVVAPELLTALSNLVECVEQLAYFLDAAPRIAEARAVIAKATEEVQK